MLKETEEQLDQKRVVKKTYALMLKDVDLISSIREKAYINQLSLTDSQIVRIGVSLTSKLCLTELKNVAFDLPRPITGRPKKLNK